MTIDVAGCDEQSRADLAAALGTSPLEATVTACSLLTLDGAIEED